MKWTGRTARRVPRAAARTAALFGMLAVTGIAAGAASASGSHASAPPSGGLSLTYQCRFPAGPRPLTATLTARLPALVKVGKPIQPTGVRLATALPPAAVAALAGLHSATVSAATRLTVSASEGSVGTSVVWPGASTRPVHLPAHGGLTLATAGAVPPVTASSPGEVALAAAGLSVTFTAGRATVPAPGPATSPTPAAPTPAARRPALPGSGPDTPAAAGATPAPVPGVPAQRPLQVNCTLAPGQSAGLGSVLVVGKARGTAPRHAAVTTGKCPKLPPGGLKLNPRFPPPPHPKLTIDAHSPSQGCAFATGYADVRKLKGAALLTPVITNVDEAINTKANTTTKVNFLELDNAAELEFHGQHEFPPTTATFLSFGFVPTTATLNLVEQGTINIFVVGPAIPGAACHPNKFRSCDNVATAFSRLQARIAPGSVKVNGVPLDVGSHCQTPPFDVILTGSNATNPPYSIQFGGPLTGMATIPHFKNCGPAADKLDLIFNAAISGPRNFNILTQGPLCTVQGAFGCVPKTGLPIVPKPIRKVTG
jgi:Family of unknown function (DUF6801)